MYRQVKFALLVVAAAMLSTLGMVSSAWALPVALTPSTTIDVSSGSGTGSGAVSTGHQIFNFDANAGELVTLDINVTAMFQGTSTGPFPDDDSMLFLFDSSGALLAQNDDFQGFQSKIVDFLLPTTGRFYAGVTTFDNNPIFTNGVISGWEDDGGSNIEFDLVVSRVSEPGTLALVALGLTGLGWARRAGKS